MGQGKADQDQNGRAEAVLAEAEAHYAVLLKTLEGVQARLSAGAFVPAPAIRKTLTEYRRATQTLFEERTRIEQLRWRAGASATTGREIDLSEARLEIGSRLDRIRGAAGTG